MPNMPMDVSRSIFITTGAEFDQWLTENAVTERDVVLAIHNKRSGKQTVSLVALQEVALCHGWVDTRTRRIDDERYAIRFVPRRPHSVWGAKNRQMARRLLAEGRIREAGLATLPGDI